MDWKAAVLLTAFLGLLVAWLGRYELVAVPAGGEGSVGYAYRLDRWTGEVTLLSFFDSYRVETEKP